jgi:methylenetetrahydrofolate dehydrogenase (NADP+)/methenyltetrahydrofolate cyclohydrolase
MAKVFEGKKLAQKKEKELAKKVAELKKKGIRPKLVSFLVGENPASLLYLKKKEEAAKRVGINFELQKFSSNINFTLLRRRIREKNNDSGVSGVMVQLPLSEINQEILAEISPEKDVDCLTPENLGLLALGKPRFLPAVVKAVLAILKFVFTQGVLPSPPLRWDIVVVGASGFVGRSLVAYLKNLGLKAIPCDEFTKFLKKWTKRGDILISATGVPGLIKKEMVKKGAVVIDVGSPKGDVDFEEVKKVASWITPVPGGVGPLTIVCLLENVLLAAKRQINSLIIHEVN